MQVGIFQIAGGGLSPEARIKRLANAIAGQNLDVVVCPELFMSGYNLGDELPEFAEAADGPFAGQMAQLARRSGTAIIYGYPERAGKMLYNSALCLDAGGAVVANHRKLIMPPGFEERYFDQGQGVALFDLGVLRCAILICYDAEFPEILRSVALEGAQVVFVPTALVDCWPIVAERLMPTRAFENGVWLVYANHAGSEADCTYYGRSVIVAPDGTDAARAGAREALIVAEVTAEAVHAAQARLPYLSSLSEVEKALVPPMG